MRSSGGWANKDPAPANALQGNTQNEEIAFHKLSEVLLVRWISFDTFIRVAREITGGPLPDNIRRDWLIFQALPIPPDGGLDNLIAAIDCLMGIHPEMLESLGRKYSTTVFNSLGLQTDTFYYVLDEAQFAGNQYMGAFVDADGKIQRPVLRPIILRMMDSAKELSGNVKMVVSGTGFSLSLFKAIMASGVGKDSWDIVHATGDFSDPDTQSSYVSRYLPSSFLISTLELISRLVYTICFGAGTWSQK